eukprot:18196_1
MLTPSSPVPISYSDQTDAQPAAVLNRTNKTYSRSLNQNLTMSGSIAPGVCTATRHTSSFMHPPPFKRRKSNHSNQCFRQKPTAAHDHLIECIIQSCMRYQQNQIVDESSSDVLFTLNANDSQQNILADNPRDLGVPTTLTSNKRDEFLPFKAFAYHTTSPGDAPPNINNSMGRVPMHSNCNAHAIASHTTRAPAPSNTYVHVHGNVMKRNDRSTNFCDDTTNLNVMMGAVAIPYDEALYTDNNAPSINAPIPRYPVLRTTSAVRVPTNMNRNMRRIPMHPANISTHSHYMTTTNANVMKGAAMYTDSRHHVLRTTAAVRVPTHSHDMTTTNTNAINGSAQSQAVASVSAVDSYRYSPAPSIFFGDQSPLPYDTMCLETNPYF